jgi:Endonuclease-reverse transcriptase
MAEEKNQGGSLILVKEFLKPYIKPMKIRSVELQFEICGVKLEVNNTKLTLVSLYRPGNPTANNNILGFFDNLESFLEQHRGVNDIILAGDLNIDLLKNDVNTRVLTDIFKSYNMSLLNSNRPTRPSDNINGGTIIDHIFTSVQNNAIFDVLNYDCSNRKVVISALDLPVVRPKDKFQYTQKILRRKLENVYGPDVKGKLVSGLRSVRH